MWKQDWSAECRRSEGSHTSRTRSSKCDSTGSRCGGKRNCKPTAGNEGAALQEPLPSEQAASEAPRCDASTCGLAVLTLGFIILACTTMVLLSMPTTAASANVISPSPLSEKV